ncbi:Transcription factor [Actinidia chinensis var. chinensis]|uniref:Transcription factor n=1 Tax=Actinidia chinensis var. chinensis TaxID=1590841 RepID=A0A2R6QLC5_ACTCC|nr:Transcription factor [Actinidia chinensis var. chinensis]
MASEEDPTVYGEEDLDEDEEEDSEEDEDLNLPTSNPPQPDLDDDLDDDDDDLLDVDDDDDTSSSVGKVTVAIAAVPTGDPSKPVTAGLVTVAAADSLLPDPKRPRIEEVTIAAAAAGKKPPPAMDDSRRLFQRLWTDEDEIELLQGFLDYTAQRGGGGGGNSSYHHHHDTAVFYDQIKSKLQLDFNKNQLVEKLRRLKKKYRNVLNKIGSGKEYVFKSPHDQATFEISRKIWSGGGLDDDEANPNSNSNSNPNPNPNFFDRNNNGIDANSSERKGSKSRKRSRVKIEEKQQFNLQVPQTATPTLTPTATSVPNLIEETARRCLSPLFKELLHNATMSGVYGSRGYSGVAAMNPMPLGFGSPVGLNFSGGNVMDEKWRKQQILELEVYSKRLELVQDQIKSALEELRSMGS